MGPILDTAEKGHQTDSSCCRGAYNLVGEAGKQPAVRLQRERGAAMVPHSSPAGRPRPCCGHTAHLDSLKGCQLFIEHILTPGAATGPRTLPRRCHPPRFWPCGSVVAMRSPPPLSNGWKFLLSRICSNQVSYETLQNSVVFSPQPAGSWLVTQHLFPSLRVVCDFAACLPHHMTSLPLRGW